MIRDTNRNPKSIFSLTWTELQEIYTKNAQIETIGEIFTATSIDEPLIHESASPKPLADPLFAFGEIDEPPLIMPNFPAGTSQQAQPVPPPIQSEQPMYSQNIYKEDYSGHLEWSTQNEKNYMTAAMESINTFLPLFGFHQAYHYQNIPLETMRNMFSFITTTSLQRSRTKIQTIDMKTRTWLSEIKKELKPHRLDPQFVFEQNMQNIGACTIFLHLINFYVNQYADVPNANTLNNILNHHSINGSGCIRFILKEQFLKNPHQMSKVINALFTKMNIDINTINIADIFCFDRFVLSLNDLKDVLNLYINTPNDIDIQLDQLFSNFHSFSTWMAHFFNFFPTWTETFYQSQMRQRELIETQQSVEKKKKITATDYEFVLDRYVTYGDPREIIEAHTNVAKSMGITKAIVQVLTVCPYVFPLYWHKYFERTPDIQIDTYVNLKNASAFYVILNNSYQSVSNPQVELKTTIDYMTNMQNAYPPTQIIHDSPTHADNGQSAPNDVKDLVLFASYNKLEPYQFNLLKLYMRHGDTNNMRLQTEIAASLPCYQNMTSNVDENHPYKKDLDALGQLICNCQFTLSKIFKPIPRIHFISHYQEYPLFVAKWFQQTNKDRLKINASDCRKRLILSSTNIMKNKIRHVNADGNPVFDNDNAYWPPTTLPQYYKIPNPKNYLFEYTDMRIVYDHSVSHHLVCDDDQYFKFGRYVGTIPPGLYVWQAEYVRKSPNDFIRMAKPLKKNPQNILENVEHCPVCIVIPNVAPRQLTDINANYMQQKFCIQPIKIEYKHELQTANVQAFVYDAFDGTLMTYLHGPDIEKKTCVVRDDRAIEHREQLEHFLTYNKPIFGDYRFTKGIAVTPNDYASALQSFVYLAYNLTELFNRAKSDMTAYYFRISPHNIVYSTHGISCANLNGNLYVGSGASKVPSKQEKIQNKELLRVISLGMIDFYRTSHKKECYDWKFLNLALIANLDSTRQIEDPASHFARCSMHQVTLQTDPVNYQWYQMHNLLRYVYYHMGLCASNVYENHTQMLKHPEEIVFRSNGKYAYEQKDTGFLFLCEKFSMYGKFIMEFQDRQLPQIYSMIADRIYDLLSPDNMGFQDFYNAIIQVYDELETYNQTTHTDITPIK